MTDFPSSDLNGQAGLDEVEEIETSITRDEIKELIRQELVSYGLIDGCAEDE